MNANQTFYKRIARPPNQWQYNWLTFIVIIAIFLCSAPPPSSPSALFFSSCVFISRDVVVYILTPIFHLSVFCCCCCCRASIFWSTAFLSNVLRFVFWLFRRHIFQFCTSFGTQTQCTLDETAKRTIAYKRTYVWLSCAHRRIRDMIQSHLLRKIPSEFIQAKATNEWQKNKYVNVIYVIVKWWHTRRGNYTIWT